MLVKGHACMYVCQICHLCKSKVSKKKKLHKNKTFFSLSPLPPQKNAMKNFQKMPKAVSQCRDVTMIKARTCKEVHRSLSRYRVPYFPFGKKSETLAGLTMTMTMQVIHDFLCACAYRRPKLQIRRCCFSDAFLC